MTRARSLFLYIISRDRPDLYRRLLAEFSDLPQVTVILDRRIAAGTPMDDRRVRTIDEDLETLGWAIVPL